jgi:hypothetical protein
MALDRQGDAACAVLQRAFDRAAPGFVGWTLPVDPLFRDLHETEAFTGVLGTLARRAR